MNFPNQPQPAQQNVVLLCPRHQEYVKGICLFNGPCPERLICRVCRKLHDKNHLNSYEEIEDLLEGNLVNDLLKEYDQILKRLDHQIITFQKENQHTVTQIDNMFAQMQEYIITKLNETRNQLVGQINKKIQSQIDLKNTLTLQKHDIDTSFKVAQNSNFQPSYVIDNFLDTVIKSQNTKTAIINDPNFHTLPGAGLSFNLSPAAANNLVQFVKTFQDKVCSDIIRSFSTPEKLTQPPPPQGWVMTSGPRFDGGMGLGGTTGVSGSNFFKNIPPQAQPTMAPGNVFPPFPFRGSGSLFKEKGSVSGRRSADLGLFGKQTGEKGSRGRGLWDESKKMEEELPTTSFGHQHTPAKLLQMFKIVDEQAKEDQDAGRSLGKGSGRGRQSYGKGSHSSDARGNKPSATQKRNKSEEQRGSDSVILRNTLDTEHKQIMFGGLAYVPNRELLITSGKDGMLEIWDAKGKDKKPKQRFKAHNSDIFKVKYIEEKDILLSTGGDGSVNVWKFKRDRDATLEFAISFKKHQGPVFALEYHPELNVMISGGEDEHLRLWKSETADEVVALKTSGTKIGSLCLLKRINRVAAGFDRGHINVIEMNQKTRKVAYTIKAHSSYVLNLVSIEERNQLVSAADDGYVKVWKVLEKTHQLLVRMQEPKTTIRGLVVFADKDLIISNHDDKHLRLWKLTTGRNVRTQHDRSFGEGLVALRNRNEIATGSDRYVKLWSVY